MSSISEGVRREYQDALLDQGTETPPSFISDVLYGDPVLDSAVTDGTLPRELFGVDDVTDGIEIRSPFAARSPPHLWRVDDGVLTFGEIPIPRSRSVAWGTFESAIRSSNISTLETLKLYWELRAVTQALVARTVRYNQMLYETCLKMLTRVPRSDQRSLIREVTRAKQLNAVEVWWGPFETTVALIRVQKKIMYAVSL